MRRSWSPKLLIISVLAVVLGLALTAAAVGRPSEASANNPNLAKFKLAPWIKEHVKSGKITIRYITNDTSIAFVKPQRVGVAKAAKQFKINAKLVGPPTGKAEDQISLMQTLITQKKVDGIAVAAVNVDSLRPVIAQAYKAGIPVISVFTNQLGFVGSDLKAGGQFEGKNLATLLNGKTGKVVVVSVDAAAGWSNARLDGFKAGLATNAGLTVVGPINTGTEPGQMFNAIQNAMQANADAVAIASLDCCSLTGAAKWATTDGKGKGIVVVGHDALQSTLNSIMDGTIAFSISQDPSGQTFRAVKMLYDYVKKGVPPKTTIVPFLLVNKANAAKVPAEG
jgi:simple sugar transport system substrate-binding protein/ribose transport system substrate-binding protein